MKTKKEIKEWLLKNCINKYGDLDLSRLNFSDFDGNVIINKWKVKHNLYQDSQEVTGNLSQNRQNVTGNLWQDRQYVIGSLSQDSQHVEKYLMQDNQIVLGDLYTGDYWVEGKLYIAETENLIKRFDEEGDSYYIQRHTVWFQYDRERKME